MGSVPTRNIQRATPRTSLGAMVGVASDGEDDWAGNQCFLEGYEDQTRVETPLPSELKHLQPFRVISTNTFIDSILKFCNMV